MAHVDNDNFYTSLPEPLGQALMGSILSFRLGENASTNEEQETLLNWAEGVFYANPVIAMFALASGAELDTETDLGKLMAVYHRKLLADVQNGQVVFTDTREWLKHHPDILAALREGEVCDDCAQDDCPLHPSHFEDEPSLPDNIEQAISNLFADEAEWDDGDPEGRWDDELPF